MSKENTNHIPVEGSPMSKVVEWSNHRNNKEERDRLVTTAVKYKFADGSEEPSIEAIDSTNDNEEVEKR